MTGPPLRPQVSPGPVTIFDPASGRTIALDKVGDLWRVSDGEIYLERRRWQAAYDDAEQWSRTGRCPAPAAERRTMRRRMSA